jgi:hypothetical protein
MLSTVYVIDDTDQETVGQLLRIERDAVVILVGETERSFEAQRVQRIEKQGDSLKNGVVIGAIVGVVFGVLSAGMLDCPGENPSGSCPGTRVAAPVLSAGMYAALGAGIDALFSGRTTLYEATPRPLSTSTSPSVSPRTYERATISVGFRW